MIDDPVKLHNCNLLKQEMRRLRAFHLWQKGGQVDPSGEKKSLRSKTLPTWVSWRNLTLESQNWQGSVHTTVKQSKHETVRSLWYVVFADRGSLCKWEWSLRASTVSSWPVLSKGVRGFDPKWAEFYHPRVEREQGKGGKEKETKDTRTNKSSKFVWKSNPRGNVSRWHSIENIAQSEK